MPLDYFHLAVPPPLLWLNLGLYASLLLVVLALVPSRLLSVTRAPARQSGLVLLLLFAGTRTGWALFLAGWGAPFPSRPVLSRVGCLVDAACAALFYLLTSLALVQVADYLTTGWKSSRRLWRLFYLLAAATPPYLVTLGLASHGWDAAVAQRLSAAADYTEASASLLAAASLLAIALRYSRMETPRVLLSFGHVRRAIWALAVLCTCCFLLRAVPLDAILSRHCVRPSLLCRPAHEQRFEPPAWLSLLHSYWLAELLPSCGMVALTLALDRLKLGSCYRSASMCAQADPFLASLHATSTRADVLLPIEQPLAPLPPPLRALRLPDATERRASVASTASAASCAARRTSATPPLAASTPSQIWLGAAPSLGSSGTRAAAPHDEVVYHNVREGELLLLESITESPFTWGVPHAWLRFALSELREGVKVVHGQMADEEQRALSRRVEHEGAAPSPREFEGEPEDWREASVLERLKYDLSRERRSSQLAWLRSRLLKLEQHVAECESAEETYRSFVTKSTWRPRRKSASRAVGFKASTRKKDATLRFVATNLHSQCLRVYAATGVRLIGTIGARSDDWCAAQAEASYCHVTCGAPAAHALGFDLGGIWQMRQRMLRCLNEIAESDQPGHKRYLSRKLDQLRFECSRRVEVCSPQAISALCTIFADRLVQELDRHAACAAGHSLSRRETVRQVEEAAEEWHEELEAAEVMEQWGEIGFLIGWESLISTIGKEQHMLGDLHGVVQSLMDAGLCFVLRREETDSAEATVPPSPRTSSCSDQTGAALTATYYAALGAEQPSPAESLGGEPRLSCSTCDGSKGAAAGGHSLNSWLAGREPAPRVVISRSPADERLVVELFLSATRWEWLPAQLRGGQSVRCVVALISQGINLQQSVANAVGETELQDKINEQALVILRTYHDDFRRMHLTTARQAAPSTPPASSHLRSAASPQSAPHSSASCGSAPEPLHRYLAELGKLMHHVERVVPHAASHHEKNTSVLALTERLVRALHGGRITSCKSGKDRTSMAITAEQATPRPSPLALSAPTEMCSRRAVCPAGRGQERRGEGVWSGVAEQRRWDLAGGRDVHTTQRLALQAALLHDHHGVSEVEAAMLTERMRKSGVRWLNMRKNLPTGLYAFNWLQQQLLPEGYRAPKGTYKRFGGVAT
ncbi:hypothetical protein AB1Y20_019728 [Prymnesium parvum]|uniref:Uncharacterized protein n=1 Tax=Prymnesium parvum TaxID=97485 RepID=A0AB34JUX6_PRYPA